jgi:hypothetical protein
MLGDAGPGLANVLPDRCGSGFWPGSLSGRGSLCRRRSRKKIARAISARPTTPTPAPIPAFAPVDRPEGPGLAG